MASKKCPKCGSFETAHDSNNGGENSRLRCQACGNLWRTTHNL